ncbi:unnamed protein product [Owenia fusiformis]|uniref:Uncharacterized protein n=1 Tax=Owenia fusiformis TaxID=6347 RepID=A0A8J1UVQ7_OWEFU|nr:unnamed protein product [Owenia fusiformis]
MVEKYSHWSKMASKILLFIFCICAIAECRNIKTVTVPHNSKPGFILSKLPFWGQAFSLEDNDPSISQFFHILDGTIMTSADISDLLGKNLMLSIKNTIADNEWYDILHVDVQNGNKMLIFPEQSYKGYVMENQPAGTPVHSLSAPLFAKINNVESPDILYSIVTGRSDLFDLKLREGQVDIITLAPLDREENSEFQLQLSASSLQNNDIAHAKITILVEDENDNIPKFESSSYNVLIPEDTVAMTTILKVKAVDPDQGKLKYSMEPSKLFRIDSESGDIVLQTQQGIEEKTYQFEIFVDDDIHREAAIVSVVVESDLLFIPESHRRNRRAVRPIRTFELDEGTTSLFSVKSPPLNDQERFALVSGTEKFNINPFTGQLTLAANQELDYEETPSITFSVEITRADDRTYIDEQPIRINLQNINDELPYFENKPENFLATVPADAQAGQSVFLMHAKDPDKGSQIVYHLESGGDDLFQVDRTGGYVRTKGNQRYTPNREYILGVSAEDINAPTQQKTPIKKLSILVGERDPQFFEPEYEANMPENADPDFSIVTIEAHSFQKHDISYELLDASGNESPFFRIRSVDNRKGEVYLIQKRDYETDPNRYILSVTATEDGPDNPRSSTTRLVINLIDINDNNPTFPLSEYIPQNSVAETIAEGTEITRVTAIDKDAGENARLQYSIPNDGNFTIETRNNVGIIKTARRLDYDFIPDHTYKFQVVAVDNGEPPRSGSAMVRVSITNVNDEPPMFNPSVIEARVNEDANPNTVVTVVQASDPDGDRVTFSLKGPSGPFEMNPNSGVITLVERINTNAVKYVLNVTATDDNSCCRSGTRQHSDGVVIIEVIDVNNNAPKFPDCDSYNPTILENQNIGLSVITVSAQDLDSGSNGEIRYSIVNSPNQDSDLFEIDPFNGTITTSNVFDRESSNNVKEYGVTIKAADRGSSSLAGLCNFKVKIGDLNDNDPTLDQSSYQITIPESIELNTRILRVYANDRDTGINAQVFYELVSDPSGFFALDRESGWLSVVKAINQREKVILEVKATDRGTPPRSDTAEVEISIKDTVNKPPVWIENIDNTPITILENTPQDDVVGTYRAQSQIEGNPGVSYSIQTGVSPESNNPKSFFSRTIDTGNSDVPSAMEVLVLDYLDYEKIPEYILTLRVANRAGNPLHTEAHLTIRLIDVNDVIPLFEGVDENNRYPASVAENALIGTSVVVTHAVDTDVTPEFARVTYGIEEKGQDWRKFSIDPVTGLVETMAQFDREEQSEYFITVYAEDGAPSARPKSNGNPNRGYAEVHIKISDVNDNRPTFAASIYNATVDENADTGHMVATVTADDNDEASILQYSIIDVTVDRGSSGNEFAVKQDTGEIYVAGKLDYENGPREYTLRYRVFDGLFDNTCAVVIKVQDVNDNKPVFTQSEYTVRNIQEESTDNPKFLVQVSATDPDTMQNTNIHYRLEGQYAEDGTFVIDPNTGEISVTRPLDRDSPKGTEAYEVNVLADDEPGQPSSLTGVAVVRIFPTDINDNAPEFTGSLIGHVTEHASANDPVLTVRATDPDESINGTVTFSIRQSPIAPNGQRLFKINPDTGLISTTTANSLDREIPGQDRFDNIIVVASDRGSPGKSTSATVTVIVDDINDQRPVFTEKLYTTTMSESLPKEASVMSVQAVDGDIGANAVLTYSLPNPDDRKYFKIDSVEATNTGVLRIHEQVDFDTLDSHFFNLTVQVTDPNPEHKDIAYIQVHVTDFNDNAPEFSPPHIPVTVPENVTIGYPLATFTATDKDQEGENSKFEYKIDRGTDKNRQFSVDDAGVVRVAKPLDRETDPDHKVYILAVDKGSPPLTGTGTLTITLTDINDNFPEFAEDYHPVVYENESPQDPVVTIRAMDPDDDTNGPPFKFWLPCNGGCPCEQNPTCDEFTMQFVQSGDSLKGAGIVKALVPDFDREKQKYYEIPIIMKDTGNPPNSGTNTLTVTIGDRNDNDHFPGHQDIFVYNYKDWEPTSEFENAPCGYVYAQDEDDWDREDKRFEFVGTKPAQFDLDLVGGMIYMKFGTKDGIYTFNVRVYDQIRDKSAVSSVKVTVQEIGDDCVRSSGSLRLTDLTAEEFLARPYEGPPLTKYGDSKRSILQKKLAEMLNTATDNVDIFTLRNHPDLKRTLDVRYCAHGSPYYKESKLNGLMEQNRDEFAALGFNIAQIPVDECYKEICESGGCENRLITTNKPLLINSNGTSLVGVTAYIEADCVCAAKTFSDNLETCSFGVCKNGGTCVDQDESGFRCICPADFDGARCQQTKHSFSGDGWAWFEPLKQCEDSVTSLSFITEEQDGIILYNGPQRPVTGEEFEDFILLELIGGFPQLRINHGSGETSAPLRILGLTSDDEQVLGKLNDGEWHRIDIYREGKKVRMVVDQCVKSTISEQGANTVEDRTACEVIGETNGDNMYLNVKDPLQLGGVSMENPKFPNKMNTKGFNGCIKDLVHNGELYDLFIGREGMHENSEDGCPREDVICGANSIDGLKCGIHGKCIGSFIDGVYRCMCDPGYRGSKCDTNTTTRDFGEDSYIEWDFKTDFYNTLSQRKNTIQLMFRTRQDEGLLFTVKTDFKDEYMNLEIRDKKIQFRYNLGGAVNILPLSYVNVSDGQWHVARVERMGKQVTLKLDHGEGRYINHTEGELHGHQLIRISSRNIYAGGDVKEVGRTSIDLDYMDSCLNDIRYDEEWFPMTNNETPQSVSAEWMDEQAISEGCPTAACVNFPCSPSPPLTCIDFWRKPVCMCPPGQMMSSGPDLCVNINECLSDPCLNGGTCYDGDNRFTCECYPEYSGEYCELQTAAVVAIVSPGAIVAIIVCLIVLLLIILLFIIYNRRRKPHYVVELEPEDDIRENIINYDEEGAGEEDQDAYDISRMQKPVDPDMPSKKVKPLKSAPPGDSPDVGDFINNRLGDADDDPANPPHDSVREYAYEGGGSEAGSLSSLNSSESSDNDNFDYLDDWGPRFSKLADMYGADK